MKRRDLVMAMLLIAFVFGIIILCKINGKHKEVMVRAETNKGISTDVIIENVIPEKEPTAEIPTEEPTEKPYKVMTVKATAYCSCEKCCGEWAKNRPTDEHGTEVVFTATGTIAIQGRTVAVDPKYIPYGTKLLIEGAKGIDNGIYIAEDCGGAIKGANRIDVFFRSHEDALEFGVQMLDIKVYE